MNEALAAEGHEVGLRLAPVVQLHRPFAGAPEVEDALAGQDNGAIDDPNQNRRYIANRNADHCFIEKNGSFDGPPQFNDRLTLAEKCERQQIAVCETLGQGDGLIGCSTGRHVIASEHGDKAIQDKNVATLDTVSTMVIEMPLGAR